MSYQVLARKWRPQRFSEVIGQQHVLSALENGLRQDKLHHAYLFSGTRGVGKTSIARLFAKGLNCETSITATPCSKCENCKAIEEGRFIDLIEIDAASRTKVEDTRELLDNVQYKPTVGRFKVYLIDEVHMLSRHSFNALLKTLEEPPEYVKFLLATTDPQKLPVTILSRCMQFHLRTLTPTQLSQHLEFILTQENIPYELAAIEKLAKAAQGSIRDSLSLTDQAIAVSNANITLPIVSEMLGLIDNDQPLELVMALAQANGDQVMAIIQNIATKGIDWQQLLNDVAETLHQIAMLQLLKQEAPSDTPLHLLAKQIPPEDVQFFYQLMLIGKKELAYAPEQSIGVEMVFLRALAFHPKRTEEINQRAQLNQANNEQSAMVDNTQHKLEQLKANLTQVTTDKTSAQAVESSSKRSIKSAQQTVPANITDSTNNTLISPALVAMQARKQLQQKHVELNQHEKKKRKSITVNSTSSPTEITTNTQHQSLDLQERLMNLAHSTAKVTSQPSVPEVASQSTEEDYRWTWLDPELAIENKSTKPAEIKQAILQDKTPELVAKTIELACEQDQWCQIINTLNLSSFSRQIALNSYLAQTTAQQLDLVLKPSMSHLDNEESRKSLTLALADKGFTYKLVIGESAEHKTPLEIRRMIFEKLTLAAKQALNNDEKLMLLRDTFAAEIDESTIRAVANI
ncbi:DNA polymerase III subunit gamma/tau [[Haemophilus] ducreyi]|uniref:DNA polymerase III subunit gamma/tau n=1 Tax=Haemophilus ducreyi TaxID=730 RepID=UPI0007CDF1A5|nr:DNA polymerase III subunit gamma/tau [[Haemophilus] ducreyi]ANF62297.1 DNA polymerase III subunit gamma/tau [[Haemophilus] ducreyi]